jgi:hypothetical protein
MKRGTHLCIAVAALALAATLAPARPHAPPKPWKDPAGPPVDAEVWLKRLVGRYRFDGSIEVVFNHADYEEHRCAPLPPPPQDPASTDPPAFPPEPYCRSVKGMADCIAVGESPGVQCVLSARWTDLFEMEPDGAFNVPGGVSNLDPSMALFGLSPAEEGGMRYLLVDKKGIAEGAAGKGAGNRSTFRTPCANAPVLLRAMRLKTIDNRPLQKCEKVFYIDIRETARVVNIAIDFEINDQVFTHYDLQLWRVEQTDVPAAGPSPGAMPSAVPGMMPGGPPARRP